MSAFENVELPLIYNRTHKIDDERQQAIRVLEQVGLAHRLHHQPTQLSGGQQQRVAIARALVNRPSLLLADEPTGNLDSRTSVEVMSLFQHINEQGNTIVLVTHEPDLAKYTRRIVELRDGRILRDEPVSNSRRADDDLLQWGRDASQTGIERSVGQGTKP
jgi:putative ABC transport system ATP-binding protein